MKKILILILIFSTLISCDLHKKEREELATQLAYKREQIQELEEEIVKIEENDLVNADIVLNDLNTRATSDLNHLYESIGEFHFFRTVEEKQQQLDAYQRQSEELREKKISAAQKKEIVVAAIDSKKDSIKQLKLSEIEYQRKLDMLK